MLTDKEIKALIQDMPANMKVGQLFFLAYPGRDPQVIKPIIEEFGITGCYISQDNAETFAEAAAITEQLQSFMQELPGKIPMILGVDQEGAWGVLVPESCTGPGNLALGAAGDPKLTEEMYRVFGEEMLSVGYNTLLSPCADVNLNPDSPIIGTRSFGEFPEAVAEHVYHAVQGAKRTGVLTTIKHFPGHGDTSGDTHRELPTVDKSLEELMKNDLLPFKRGIEAGADLVMTSHILYPQLDPKFPATLSRIILQDLLRERLGFQGVIVSDSMNMGAIRKYYDPAESTLMALQAGVDVIMLAEEHYDHDQHYLEKQLQSLRRVKEAIVRGELPMEVVDEKLMRILKLKFQHMKVKAAPLTAEQRRANRAVEEECARRAITLIADPKGNWPVQMDGSVICINATPREAYANMVNIRGIGPNQATPAFDTFQGELARLAPEVKFFASEQLEEALQSATPASTVLVVTEDYPLPGEDFAKEKQQDNVRRIIRECGEKVVVIGLRSAYEFKQYPAGVTYVSAFSSRTCSAVQMARMLVQGELPQGKSPITYSSR